MGFSTDFVGHIDISPHLNDGEIAYLEAFRHARHFDRGGSPYDVPGNPMAPDREGIDVDSYNALAVGKPQLYCQWAVCGKGCCLSFDGNEKFYEPERWLRYLIDHLLGPDAFAASVGHPQLTEFSFDHRLDGIVVGCRRDTRELFALTAVDNEVARRVLRPGEPQPWEEPPLAYQEAIDRDRADRNRRSVDSPAALAAIEEAGYLASRR